MTDAHRKVQRGLQIGCPVLSMHSDEADVVLDWRHIARYSRGLGPDVAVPAVPCGVPELLLSPREVREEVLPPPFPLAAPAPARTQSRQPQRPTRPREPPP